MAAGLQCRCAAGPAVACGRQRSWGCDAPVRGAPLDPLRARVPQGARVERLVGWLEAPCPSDKKDLAEQVVAHALLPTKAHDFSHMRSCSCCWMQLRSSVVELHRSSPPAPAQAKGVADVP